MEMVLWETKFWAISQVTGQLEEFYGAFIKAENLFNAHAFLRQSEDCSYLQLTGVFYESLEEFNNGKMFLTKLEEVETPLSSMSFDDFYDWLKKAPTLDDLLLAKDRVIQEGGMEDYIPLINVLIENYGKDKKGGEEASN